MKTKFIVHRAIMTMPIESMLLWSEIKRAKPSGGPWHLGIIQGITPSGVYVPIELAADADHRNFGGTA